MDDSPTWRKEYALRDHLGNTRLMFADKNANGIVDVTNSAVTSDILQENHYYPFGLGYEGGWLMNDAARDNKYQYNKKELNDDFGLNWYAYGKRWYDPSIGRFIEVDPIADKFAWVSPYNYAENEPIAHIDLWGLQKYKPKMQSLDKPSDLFSKKMVNNLYEGVKKMVIEGGSIINQAVGRGVKWLLPQGTPEASDFHDSGESRKGSGVEILSNTELNSNGTLPLPSADKGSTVILEESDIYIPGDAGGVVKDDLKNALETGKGAIDKIKEASKGSQKLDTTYNVKSPMGGGTIKVSKFSPTNEKEKNK